jgi:hypothetical protein
MFRKGTVQIDGKDIPIKGSSSGDGACHSSNWCHSSFLGMYCCPLCHIEKKDIMEYDLDVLKNIEMRTRDSIRMNTHRQPSGDKKCRGCNLWVCETDEQ